MRIGTSPPKEKCENSITEAARIVATPASVALPPCLRILSPASTERGLPPATTPRLPRTTGRKVSACEAGGHTAARMNAAAIKPVRKMRTFGSRIRPTSQLSGLSGMSYRILMLIRLGVNVMIDGIVMQVDPGPQAKLKGASLPRGQRPRLYLSSPLEN